MARLIGIDLGTTYSLVATLSAQDGRPRIVPNRAGQRMTPSVVGLDPEGRLVVGAAARAQLTLRPEATVAEVKRQMGSGAPVRLGSRSYSPTEISAHILTALREDAEAALGGPVDEAVITVPAYFTDAQRQATRDAGQLAGLKVERILNEPTAAALAYGLDHLDQEQHVLVYDLGGGTFDVSLLEMFHGVLDVKASAGNNRLGGGDFDRAVAAFLQAEFEARHHVSLAGDAVAQARLKEAGEQAKIALSDATVTRVRVPDLARAAGRSLDLDLELTRERLEALIGDLVRSTLQPVESVLRDARLAREAVTDIVLVGGSSRLPLVRRLLADAFRKDPREGVNPDEAVALGAAVQAGLKGGAISAATGIMITDVCPFTLGVEVMAYAGREALTGLFSPIIPRNTTIPVSRTETYATTSENQKKVEIRVFQGEARTVRQNVFLDQYSVDGIPPGPAGAEKVAVTFTYDINGILQVKTRIVSTGKDATLVIDHSPHRMSDADRQVARERLQGEWTPAAPTVAPAVAAPVAAPLASSPPPPPPPPPAESTRASEREALLRAATERLAGLGAADRGRIEPLIRELREAGDAAAAARAESRLTDALFDLL